MLKFLRKKGVAKKLLWAVAIVIIISFGFFGTAYLVDDTVGNYAGKIFGQTVSFDHFSIERQHKNIQALILYGDSYKKVLEFLDLDAQTWDRIILIHESKKRNIKVTDKEVVDTIENYPFFQRDNQFDTLLYNDILRSYFRMRARDFEEGIRNSIIISKLYDQVTLPISITKEEILSEYKSANESIQVNYILFEIEKYKSPKNFELSMLENYYKEHKKEFMLPPSINVEYVKLEFSKETTDDEKENLLAKADEIYDALIENPDLNSISKQLNFTVETTGFFSREQPNLAVGWSFQLLQEAFQLAEDDYTQPIETDTGIYILKLKEKKPSHIASLEDVSEKIKAALELESAQEAAKKQADNYLNQLKEKSIQGNVNLKEFAKSIGLEAHQTSLFKRGDYLPTIGISDEFQEAAFLLNDENKISDLVIKTSKGYCILQFESYIPFDAKQFDVEKEALSQQLTAKKKNEAFNNFLSRLRIKAKLVDNISKVRDVQNQ